MTESFHSWRTFVPGSDPGRVRSGHGRPRHPRPGARPPHRLARLRRQRRRAPRRLRRLRPPRAPGRPRPRPRHEGEAQPRGGARDRGARAGPAAGRGAVPALRRLRRLPVPGLRLRGAAGGEAGADRRLAAPARRDRGAAGRPDRPLGLDLRLPQQARVLVHADRGRPRARLPRRRALGPGAADRGVPAHERHRQRDPRLGPGLGARGGARRLRPEGRDRLPAPPRRPRGPQHRAGARPARHRRGRAVRPRLPDRDAPQDPGGQVDPLGRQRHARRGHQPALAAALGRGGDRGGAARAPLPRPPERVPADEHRDGRDALPARDRGGRADRRRDRVRPVLRHRHDGPGDGRARAHGVGRRDLGGVGRVRDRERRAERDLRTRRSSPATSASRSRSCAAARGSPMS